jgi:hypothetical protein
MVPRHIWILPISHSVKTKKKRRTKGEEIKFFVQLFFIYGKNVSAVGVL